MFLKQNNFKIKHEKLSFQTRTFLCFKHVVLHYNKPRYNDKIL